MVASEQLNSDFLIIKMQNYHRTGNMNTNHYPSRLQGGISTKRSTNVDVKRRKKMLVGSLGFGVRLLFGSQLCYLLMVCPQLFP